MNNRVIAGKKVAPVGLGCMGLSHAYGTAVEKSEAVNILRQAFDMGYNFFDTAECYPYPRQPESRTSAGKPGCRRCGAYPGRNRGY